MNNLLIPEIKESINVYFIFPGAGLTCGKHYLKNVKTRYNLFLTQLNSLQCSEESNQNKTVVEFSSRF